MKKPSIKEQFVDMDLIGAGVRDKARGLAATSLFK
ncbi:IS1-like element transposase [Rahnella bonaserana]|uniref:Insertion element IS1 protein InsA helix-turn-helix domain-containing protein n=1 Tax=Rahnella bonaserana TaxID=2816248 RepID=A0ABS6LT16_9GAMM|nr:hypothetical protein [Rahnella bonaserana]